MHPIVRNELTLRVFGRDNLEDVRAPLILFSNHSSHLDATLIMCTLPDRWQAKTAVGAARDYFFDVWWRQAFTALVYGAFPIDRARGARARSTRRASCSRRWSIVVFPEGTRSADGHLQRFRHGRHGSRSRPARASRRSRSSARSRRCRGGGSGLGRDARR